MHTTKGVCSSEAIALHRRGHHAIHGDRELSYQGDPETGVATDTHAHEHHIWNIGKVEALVKSRDAPITFFCGGSRNFSHFIGLFDGVFILEVDRETLLRRLEARSADEWGGREAERALIVHLHHTKEDVPAQGMVIDATRPLALVVDEIIGLTAR